MANGGIIMCHPDTEPWLRSQIAEFERPRDAFWVNHFRMFFGLEIQTSEACPRWVRRWVPPEGQFWECEESDRDWCEKLGWGHWEDTDQPFIARIAPPDLTTLMAQSMVTTWA